MDEASENRLLRRIIERLDVVESLLLSPERAKLGTLLENLEQSSNSILALETAVRSGAGDKMLQTRMEGIRSQIRRITNLIKHAGFLLDGLQTAACGGYSPEGTATVPGRNSNYVSQEG